MPHNKYDKYYEFRLGKREEIPQIMDYIAEDWKPGHILSVNRELFEHEYVPFDGDAVNVMLAIRKEDGRIDGMLGFIPSSNDKLHMDLWGSVWKTRAGSIMFLGNEILLRLLHSQKCRNYAAVGINMKTAGRIVNRSIQAYIGRMRQWYLLNDMVEYRIAVITKKVSGQNVFSSAKIQEAYSVNEIIAVYDFEKNTDARPYKNRWYIQRRYFDYPINKYRVWLIRNEDVCDAFFVTREVTARGAKVLRIVDFIGNRDRIGEIGGFLKTLCRKNNYEYVDFYEYGVSEDQIKKAGFVERKEGDSNIIPNYFSPFVQENIEIYFHAPDAEYVCFKADGDQDRPN